MQIRKRPYGIDFAGNSPEFVLRATPWYQQGRCWSGTFRVDSLPTGTLHFSSLRIGGIPGTSELVWTVKSNPGDGLYELLSVASGAATILDALEAKVIYNPTLRHYFDVSAWVHSGSCFIKFTSLTPEPEIVDFHHEEYENAILWTEGVTGAKQKPKSNYRVLAFFTGQAGGKNFQTPDMMMEVSNGDVHIDCSLLNAWFPKPDIPAWEEFYEAKACPAAILTARLWYGEMYADDTDSTPILRTLDRCPQVTLLNGRVSQYAADNNIPDWVACNDDHLHLKSGVDILGQNNGETVIVPSGVEQYIYLYNYGTVNRTVRVQVRATFADGFTDDGWRDKNLTIVPGVNRLTVREDDAVAWTVKITNYTFHITITRHYVVKEFEYGFHTFLMLNALNLYESLPVEFLAREEQTEGERRIIAGVDSYGTTDRQTVFTARCLPRNASGLKLLRTAFDKQDNLLLEGQYAWYIDMIPGSITLSDESNFLSECEFKFRLREKVNRKPQVFELTDGLDTTSQILKQDTVFK